MAVRTGETERLRMGKYLYRRTEGMEKTRYHEKRNTNVLHPLHGRVTVSLSKNFKTNVRISAYKKEPVCQTDTQYHIQQTGKYL